MCPHRYHCGMYENENEIAGIKFVDTCLDRTGALNVGNHTHYPISCFRITVANAYLSLIGSL